MRVDQFNFDLPERLIALRPAVPRDSARLLVIREDGSREHRLVRDLPELLRRGDLLVVNDSKVVPARLHGTRQRHNGESPSSAKVEVLLYRRVDARSFRALARPAKRFRPGDAVRFGSNLTGSVISRAGGEVEIAFDQESAELDTAISAAGEMPLPPYIAGKRAADLRDRADYQTVYARVSGSVAAPTAGLHFTPELLQDLANHGVAVATLTLHVGLGTFLPVTAEDSANHVMHSESVEISPDVAHRINDARASGGRIVAVGSTALRSLETAADASGRIHPFKGETGLFITPGFQFKSADVLLTNFHLPRSTLFMLVSAFSGTEVMKSAYSEAIKEGYRFYSYGDACLLFRASA
jgi:S-adenosylmethionine:tRNA ribosyltransferase-isomerase